MAVYKARPKNLTLIKDKTVITFNGGLYETSDKSIIKIIEGYAKSIPELMIQEIKSGE